jgi:hypothetical protein
MFMSYLRDDKEYEDASIPESFLSNKRFVKTWMFDTILKSFLVLLEETLKSKYYLSHLKIEQLQSDLMQQKLKNEET